VLTGNYTVERVVEIRCSRTASRTEQDMAIPTDAECSRFHGELVASSPPPRMPAQMGHCAACWFGVEPVQASPVPSATILNCQA